jgi:hypothetical protein
LINAQKRKEKKLKSDNFWFLYLVKNINIYFKYFILNI